VSTEIASCILQCWHEQNTNRLKVIRVDTGGEVALSKSSFLLRLFVDDTTAVERCLIRHLMSGREVYIQSGSSLQAFIKSCLLNDDTPPPESTVGETQ
jgi:hypothetical protein